MDNIEFIQGFIGLLGIGLVTGLIQMFKPFIKDHRYLPFLSLAFGLGINFLAGYFLGMHWVISVFNGIIAGLAASGLYSGAKEITGNQP